MREKLRVELKIQDDKIFITPNFLVFNDHISVGLSNAANEVRPQYLLTRRVVGIFTFFYLLILGSHQ